MLAIDLINSFKKILTDERGDFDIPKTTVLDILQSYEDELGADKLGSDGDLSRIEHYYNGQRDFAKRSHDVSLEQYKIVNASGQSAMRSFFIMNGGASIAMSAFIGTLAASSQMETKVAEMAFPLGMFAFGTLAASIAFGLSYLTHFIAGYDDEPKWRQKLGVCSNICAIVFCFGSILFFGFGLFHGYQIMR